MQEQNEKNLPSRPRETETHAILQAESGLNEYFVLFRAKSERVA
jgi:hypothetical protein